MKGGPPFHASNPAKPARMAFVTEFSPDKLQFKQASWKLISINLKKKKEEKLLFSVFVMHFVIDQWNVNRDI